MLTAKDILKSEGIIKARSDDTISSALARLSSSHDVAFIFSEDDGFMGIVNPYYCLIKSSYPGNAKVSNCLFHPPKVAITDTLDRITNLINGTKMHYLPVFDEGNQFVGIVTANRILTACHNLKGLDVIISEVMRRKNKQIITIDENDPVSTAINLYKIHKISKLVVISKDLKLRGILSYYDLIHFLISPKEKLRQGEREGNKIGFYHQPVKNFARANVLTMPSGSSMKEALQSILEKKIGSMVIIDEERHPIYILTKRDFLEFIVKLPENKALQITKKNLSQQSNKLVEPFFNFLCSFINKVPSVRRASVVVKEEKQGGVFKIILSLFPKEGAVKIIVREGKNLRDILKEVGSRLLGSAKINH